MVQIVQQNKFFAICPAHIYGVLLASLRGNIAKYNVLQLLSHSVFLQRTVLIFCFVATLLKVLISCNEISYLL